jgi:hypothetical protein
MPRIPIEDGRSILIDQCQVAILPLEVRVLTNCGRAYPFCGEGRNARTAVRALALAAGRKADLYHFPANGDDFDCRVANIRSVDKTSPEFRRIKWGVPVDPEMVPGIVVKGRSYQVILPVNGKGQWFGTFSDLKTAKKRLKAVKLTL